MLGRTPIQLFIELLGDGALLSVFEWNGEKPQLNIFEEFPKGSPDELRKRVRSITNAKRIKYVPVLTTVSPESVFVKKASLDAPVRAKDPLYLRDYMEDELKLKAEDHVYQILNVTDGGVFDPEVSLQKDILFAGARKDELGEMQEYLVDAGVYPERLELSVLSMMGGMLGRSRQLAHPIIVLDFGRNDSFIFIVNKGNLDLVRSIPYGLDSLLPLVQDELGLDSVESARDLLYSNTFDFTSKADVLLANFSRELQTSIDYYEVQTGMSVNAVYASSVPKALSWVGSAICSQVDGERYDIDFEGWRESMGLEVAEGIDWEMFEARGLATASVLENYITARASK